MMQGWWISWYNDLDITTFELHAPWWVSGYDSEMNETIVAAVRARDEDDARRQVRLAYDLPPSPASFRWRFCEPLLQETPFNSRFPKNEWMAWDEQGTCMCAKHGGPR